MVISKSRRQTFRKGVTKRGQRNNILLEEQELYQSKERNSYKRYYKNQQYAEWLKKNNE